MGSHDGMIWYCYPFALHYSYPFKLTMHVDSVLHIRLVPRHWLNCFHFKKQVRFVLDFLGLCANIP